MDAKEKGKSPTFPLPGWMDIPTRDSSQLTGLTKRELFAALAMQGMCGGVVGVIGREISAYAEGPCNIVIADRAVALADALLNELEK